MNKPRNIKLRRIPTPLTIPDLMPINPHMKSRIYALEPQPQLMTTKRFRDAESPQIAARFVGIVWDMWWIHREGKIGVRIPILTSSFTSSRKDKKGAQTEDPSQTPATATSPEHQYSPTPQHHTPAPQTRHQHQTDFSPT